MSPSPSAVGDKAAAGDPALPALGTRFTLSGYTGTIRYIGSVDGTNGTWLGVEWDEPDRGKHDGIKDGKRYFSCLVAGSGSFIRPLPTLQYGKTFLRGLIDKYVEQLHGSETQETVILGSSNGAIQVEAVNLDKIRGKFSRLDRLQEVSLDKENVSGADAPGELREKCPSIRGVDLSYSLIPSWDVVALVATELPSLERLALNNNRLQPPSYPEVLSGAFSCLTELQLNATLVTWEAALNIVTLIPDLKHLELGYNRLEKLTYSILDLTESVITTLNFDGNQLSDWVGSNRALMPFQRLTRLILSSNPIKSIPIPTELDAPLQLTHLSLSSTGISEWSSIDALNAWCPQLEFLSLNGIPLLTQYSDTETGRVWQQLAIARLPKLRILDGASISQRQRIDAELFYLSSIARVAYPSEAARSAAHPRWAALCEAHGAPITKLGTTTKEDKLKNRLIEIRAGLSTTSPSTSAPDVLASAKSVSVLPSAPLRVMRLKVFKLFKTPRGTEGELWVRMADGSFAPLGDATGADEEREIDWWLESGSEVVLYIKQ
ncbi:hypothetical protein BC834DRAFT_990854 [Gloeopeniophorella convolvens]|nr:hypothetical protein BC834DRAFT_990854 [Gloeopeniophorella convolvens]